MMKNKWEYSNHGLLRCFHASKAPMPSKTKVTTNIIFAGSFTNIATFCSIAILSLFETVVEIGDCILPERINEFIDRLLND